MRFFTFYKMSKQGSNSQEPLYGIVPSTETSDLPPSYSTSDIPEDLYYYSSIPNH